MNSPAPYRNDNDEAHASGEYLRSKVAEGCKLPTMSLALRPLLERKDGKVFFRGIEVRVADPDPDGALVPLPQRSEPAPRPFVPNKFGEHD